jgi:transcriptional regulator with XRE-family HTH domain
MSPESSLLCDIRASFACAFSNWRRKNKLPLKKVAADLGVSISTVNLWESGKRFPGSRNFEMLLDYTGLPPCKLFCVMADKCVPTDCLLALHRLASKPV